MLRSRMLFLVLLAVGFFGCLPLGKVQVPVWKVKVVASYPHDSTAYTQGLIIEDGKMFEGTGKYGSSSLREIELQTGKVLRSIQLSTQYFGEGITVLDGKIFQLTWKNNICLTYDLNTFRFKEHFRYLYEGWGLTDNGTELIVSDGSSDIRFVDPNTFTELRKISVKEGNDRIKNLNELEYVSGEIWANVWYDDRIARISPANGQLLGWIDVSTAYPQLQRPDRDNVLNGIAFDEKTKKIYVTGKNWPKLFEIEIVR